MSLSTNDIQKLAQLAKLEVTEAQDSSVISSINNILGLVNNLSQVDTTGVDPLYHPLSLIQSVPLPLHQDAPLPVSTAEQRGLLMQNAPLENDGLFLVPNVIE